MPEVLDPVEAPPLTLAETLGGMVDQLYLLTEEKRVLDSALADLDRKRKFVEQAVMNKLDEQKLERGGGALANVSITTSIVPDVVNWDDFYAFISRKKYWHLLERRPSSAGCRELFETKGKIPGVVPYNKVRLSLRKA